MLANDLLVEDRRRGLRREGNGPAAELAELRAIADLGVRNMTSDVLAARGARLALVRTLYTGRDTRPEAFDTEVIRVAEIDCDERLLAYVVFDTDDIDAAFAELDARYLAGEAAAHAEIWQFVTGGYEALNHLELPATTPDWVNVDHRRVVTFESGDLAASFRAMFELAPEVRIHLKAVYRLSNLGAVVTHLARGASQDGFNAEWSEVSLLTFEGNLISRCEIFDEADLDAALARFEELTTPSPRLENSAGRCLRPPVVVRRRRRLGRVERLTRRRPRL